MRSEKKKNKNDRRESDHLLIILSVVALLSLAFMTVTLFAFGGKGEKPAFVPPDFDANALIGTPEPPEDSGYRVVCREGMSFEVGLCGRVAVRDKSARVYLTNPEVNTLWLKIRIYDGQGTVIGESGLVKPGEYIESISLSREVDVSERIQLKIMSYEPETYYSGGAIVMNPMLVVEE